MYSSAAYIQDRYIYLREGNARIRSQARLRCFVVAEAVVPSLHAAGDLRREVTVVPHGPFPPSM